MEKKGQAKLLGESVFELDTILASLGDSVGVGIKKALKFSRSQGDKTVTVGRFVATFQIVGDYNTEENKESPQQSKMNEPQQQVQDIDRQLPDPDFGSARWRIKIGAHCATNAPVNAEAGGRAPSIFLQIGWTQYKQDDPSTLTMIKSNVVEESRHPVWNDLLLFNNPPESDKPCILLISIKIKNSWIFVDCCKGQNKSYENSQFLHSY